ncbi:MAG TPA: PEGA domain-containing protein [Polyangiaceae bacterium]|nr:PEGA domain-containing protein [Polyangiaceae bacterium]
MGAHRRLAASLLVGAALLAPPASAQNAGKAQTHLIAGEAAARKGDWKAALEAFRKAHEASPSGATAVRVAGALYALGQLVEAHEAYREALDKHGSSLFGADKKKAKERLEELAGKIGTLEVLVSEADARIRIDDQVVGSSPLATRRVPAGEHTIKVTKPGFSPVTKTVDVAAGDQPTKVELKLQAVSTMGKISVSVSGGEGLTVVIDGNEVGPAPYTGEIEPGEHDISARSKSQTAPAQKVVVKEGETTSVELVAGVMTGKLEVRIKDEEGTVLIDGEKVGDGNWQGELPIGEHELKVTRPGYEPFEKTINVTATDVHVETVVLRKAAEGDTLAERDEGDWTFDGLYGGLELSGSFFPIGTGNSIEGGCDALGATSCDSGFTAGGSIGGYIGYAFAPLGFEALLLAGGDVASPKASFDGVTGSEINPLVAAPEREESFTIGRVGGGGALRVRVLVPIDRFRVTGAVGAGAAYRHMLLARDTTAASGATSKYTDSVGYITPVLSFELAGQVRIAGNTALALGLDLWLEHAPSSTKSEASGNQVLVSEGEIPNPQFTPAYDLARGTQLYLGPFVGFQFGP